MVKPLLARFRYVRDSASTIAQTLLALPGLAGLLRGEFVLCAWSSAKLRQVKPLPFDLHFSHVESVYDCALF
jgi:hypothetical protein